ncbi:uncharacterized protein CMC5_057630 [Chondromyces crocatus]|uniref:Uncharacterized protein n=2 Tax=Chondromyces crocatus TaxID=52 RepID=A0A0K1EL83_CHOCO|nr:uncharacterized protein CMC5_057630 [Chondromyces crocatus]
MGKAEQPKATGTPASGAPAERTSTAITGGASPATTPTTTAPLTPMTDEKAAPKDLLFVHSPSDDGQGLRVIRKREDRLELGEIRALQEGRPVHGEVVRLRQRDEHERLFDVEVMVDAPGTQGRSGPAQVATDAYRSNWDAIFGRPGHGGSSAPN